MDLILYDEVENFYEYDSPLFNYPYENRKNVIRTLSFNSTFNNSNFYDNYEYMHENIYF